MKGFSFNSNKFYLPLVVLLLAVMFFMEFTSALKENQTIDEGSHLASGYTYITTGNFKLNPEHPPLIKEISAIPLLFLPIEAPLNHPSWQEQNQWEFGREFLYNNTADADLILLLGRIPTMLLSLLLGVLIYKWATSIWGRNTGLVALILYVFEPNILAHSRYVTTDLGATLFFFFTIYCLDKYFINFSRKSLFSFILVFAIAQFVKFSAIILYLFFLIFIILKIIHKKSSQLKFSHFFKITFLLLLMTFILGSFVYGFSRTIPITDPDVQYFYNHERTAAELEKQQNDDPFIAKLRSFVDPTTKTGNFFHDIAENTAIPGYYYIKGLFTLSSHNYWGHMSYLNGQYSNVGFWNYFPVTFLIKTPLAMIIILSIGMILFFFRHYRKNTISKIKNNLINLIPSKDIKRKLHFRELLGRIVKFYRDTPYTYWLLILTPILYFLWSMTSKINIGHRHVLIIYPFLILLCARVITYLFQNKNRYIKIISFTLLIWYMISTILIYPNFLAYFNELIGGPKNGSKYVTDSNIDWGQDVIKFKKYLDENNIDEYYFTYFGSLRTSYYGIPFQPVPKLTNQEELDKLDRIVAISVSALFSNDGTYIALQNIEPDDRIGYSINIYDFRK